MYRKSLLVILGKSFYPKSFSTIIKPDDYKFECFYHYKTGLTMMLPRG